MTDAIQNASDAVENIPGFDVVNDTWNEVAEEYLQTKEKEAKSVVLLHPNLDPFFVKDKDGEEVRREAPAGITKEEKKIWKHIIRKAWVHDKSFLGGTYWLDIGLGSAPLVSLIPIIGPITMYVLHGRLVSLAEELRIPATLHAKMTANITFDFLMSLIPVLGAIFSWMNTCSVRNAALVDTHVRKRAQHLQSQIGEFQVSDRGPNRPVTRPSNPPQFQQGAPARPQPQFQQAQQPAPSKKKRGQANYQETGVL